MVDWHMRATLYAGAEPARDLMDGDNDEPVTLRRAVVAAAGWPHDRAIKARILADGGYEYGPSAIRELIISLP